MQPLSVLMLQAAAEEAALRVELAKAWPPDVRSLQVLFDVQSAAHATSDTAGWNDWLMRRKE